MFFGVFVLFYILLILNIIMYLTTIKNLKNFQCFQFFFYNFCFFFYIFKNNRCFLCFFYFNKFFISMLGTHFRNCFMVGLTLDGDLTSSGITWLCYTTVSFYIDYFFYLNHFLNLVWDNLPFFFRSKFVFRSKLVFRSIFRCFLYSLRFEYVHFHESIQVASFNVSKIFNKIYNRSKKSMFSMFYVYFYNLYIFRQWPCLDFNFNNTIKI